MNDHDAQVRAAAFRFLAEQTLIHGPDGLPWKVLEGGFDFEGVRVPLFVRGPGIFKPAILDLPLSMTTAPQVEGRARPYEDELSEGGRILYRYRGTDPMHRDNVGLRRAMEAKLPLVYLFGLVPGLYLPTWPAIIVDDDPGRLTFTVQVDHDNAAVGGAGETDEVDWPEDSSVEIRRAYYTGAVKRRAHQQEFRQRVLRAYRGQCSVCRLKHAELLDAAHIIPDNEGGRAVVSNGLSLCKLHHAAFDRNILGVNPDLVIEIRQDILDETDGPMLQHGLKQTHGEKLKVPRKPDLRPDPSYLERRYERFRKAS